MLLTYYAESAFVPPFPDPAALSGPSTLQFQQKAYEDYLDDLKEVQEAQFDVQQARLAFNQAHQYLKSVGSNHFPKLEYFKLLKEMKELAVDRFELEQAKQLWEFYATPQNHAANPQITAPVVNSQNAAVNPQITAVNPQKTAVNPQKTAVNLQNAAVNPQNTAVNPQNAAVNPQNAAVNLPNIETNPIVELNHKQNKANKEYFDDLQDVQEAEQEVAQARIEFVTALQILQSTKIGPFPIKKYQKLQKKMLKFSEEMDELNYSKQYFDYLNQQNHA